jgi:DNA-binding beta-propeller fold protein YncE
LVALESGWVIVGSLPTVDGTAATAKAGCLLVLNSQGQVVETFAGRGINGPWDMTALDLGGTAVLFVTNVLNGTVAAGGKVVHQGTVLRLLLDTSSSVPMPKITGITTVGSGFGERTDPAALVIGPTGLALSADNSTLYVANSLGNSITTIANPIFRTSSSGAGKILSRGGQLNDPLGLTLSPNGDVIAANGDDGNLVEIDSTGTQVAHKLVDSSGNPPGGGTLFGLIALPKAVYFVDDGTNTLNRLTK